MGHRDRTPGNPIVDVTVMKLPHNDPSQAPRSTIRYIWIFHGTSGEEVVF